MPFICYKEYSPDPFFLDLIHKANSILNSFRSQGYNLTLRQLYYQFVSQNILPERWADKKTGSTNNKRAYDNLGSLMSKARKGGLIDWNYLEDRTRNLQGIRRYANAGEAIRDAADTFHLDWWKDQEYRVEVWVEKEALVDVVGKAANSRDCRFIACKGYMSDSEMWLAGNRRMVNAHLDGQVPVILHLGDHDPSGVDMSRDIEERIRMFMDEDELNWHGYGQHLIFERIALNMPQIIAANYPKNPAKTTDTRSTGYIDHFGPSSWELDAVPPQQLRKIITDAIDTFISDIKAWNAVRYEEKDQADKMLEFANTWKS